MQLLKRDLIASLNIRAKVALNLQARSGVLLLGTPSYYLVDPYYTGPYLTPVLIGVIFHMLTVKLS